MRQTMFIIVEGDGHSGASRYVHDLERKTIEWCNRGWRVVATSGVIVNHSRPHDVCVWAVMESPPPPSLWAKIRARMQGGR